MEVSGVRPSVVRRRRQHFQMTSPLKPRSRFFSYFTYSIYRSGERIIVFFCSGRIRTIVAMATYSSHRLIMEKRGNGQFFLSHWGFFNFFLYRNVY